MVWASMSYELDERANHSGHQCGDGGDGCWG